ncbi:glycosyltransferase family 2 protein [Methanocorpusculum bavaricum]|uniref:glycosyltransferase family 2 protein n=1 Tax=Methanocorpusculum bavaricum TaxID=71518 RepID=UPI0006946F5C|nr:glycosyltransferase family 2 protein [Methanocorpusculum bavaricum]
MSFTPKVSVIIPVFNVDLYLRQCLSSICNQTLKEIEIICVDDGSTDNSLNILKQYQTNDPRIILLHQANKGGGAARNLGLRHATGDYLVFLDSDDFFELAFLEKMYARAIETGSDLMVCQYRNYHTVTHQVSVPLGISSYNLPCLEKFSYTDISKSIFMNFSLFPWNKLYSRSMIEKNNLKFQEIHHHNDNYFSAMSIVSANRISIILEPFIYYRRGMKTNTQSRNFEHPYDFSLAITAICQSLKAYNIYARVEPSFLEYVLFTCAVQEKKLRGYPLHKEVWNYILNTLFSEYNITNLPSSYFYNKKGYWDFLKIRDLSYPSLINQTLGVITRFIISHPLHYLRYIFYLFIIGIRTIRHDGFVTTIQHAQVFVRSLKI